MRTIPTRGSILGLALLLAIPAGEAVAQSYRIVDLGTLGGHASGSDGINDRGETVGWSIAPSGAYYGFVSAPVGPPLTNLGPPPNGTYSYAQAANDARQVVGYAEVAVGFGREDRAFLWQGGVMTDLGTLGGNASQAWGINALGQVVGWAEDGEPGVHAFLWEDGGMVALPGLRGPYADSAAQDINDAGIAVGHSWDPGPTRQAVVWEDGAIARVLDLPPGATGATAFAINNRNQVAGNLWGAGGTTTAVLWDEEGHATPLPRIASHYYNVAYGLNDDGIAVGQSYSGGHSGGGGGPVLWEDGLAFDLVDIIAPTPGVSVTNVSDINEAGQIAATGGAGSGYRALRLDPIPGGLGLTGPDPAYVGQENRLAVRGARPGARVFFVLGFASGSTPVPGCPGLAVGLADARRIGSAIVDANGHAVFAGVIPAGFRGRTALFQAVEAASCRASNPTSRSFF